MSSTNILTVILTRMLYMVPTVVILVASVVYLVRVKGVEGVLCVIGQCLVMLGHFGWLLWQVVMMRGTATHETIARLSQLMQVPFLLGNIVFAVGFLMIALKQRPATAPVRPPPVA